MRAKKVKSIYEIMGKSDIKEYILQDREGGLIEVSAIDLKGAIRLGKVDVVNLTLSSDNRLIPTNQKENNIEERYVVVDRSIIDLVKSNVNLNFKSNIDTTKFKGLFAKAKVSGIKVDKINEDLIILTNGNNVSIVSDKQIALSNNAKNNDKNAGLFQGKVFNSIDLRETETAHMRNMSYMFNGCRARNVNMQGINTKKVSQMNDMFESAIIEEIDLSYINTTMVENMSYMFYNCKIDRLNLSGFDTSSVRNMTLMFAYSSIDSIDVSMFRGYGVRLAYGMFSGCRARHINLGKFSLPNLERTSKYTGRDLFSGYMGTISTDSPLMNTYYESRN